MVDEGHVIEGKSAWDDTQSPNAKEESHTRKDCVREVSRRRDC